MSVSPHYRSLSQRVGDAERDATCDLLGAHFSAGRISAEELQARTSAALSALTMADLRALTADLPRLSAAPVPGHPGPRPVPAGRPNWALDAFVGFISVSAAICLLGLLLLTTGSSAGPVAFLATIGAATATSGVWYFTRHLRCDGRCRR
ncbi:MAG: DUF1707 domain-containing protein [Propionibacteriaceae bacterium]|nr:DUF1707 domain-containing protein [Propionibacteriaceae bacterium]